MAFTSLQKTRIKFHLGQLTPDRWVRGLSEPTDFAANAYDAEIELMVVGDQTVPPAPGTEENDFLDGTYSYAGQRIAEPYSALWHCEVAYKNMSPVNVDPSLLVSRAGDVRLREDEFEARNALYQHYREQLSGILGYPLADYGDYVKPSSNRYRSNGENIYTSGTIGVVQPFRHPRL